MGQQVWRMRSWLGINLNYFNIQTIALQLSATFNKDRLFFLNIKEQALGPFIKYFYGLGENHDFNHYRVANYASKLSSEMVLNDPTLKEMALNCLLLLRLTAGLGAA